MGEDGGPGRPKPNEEEVQMEGLIQIKHSFLVFFFELNTGCVETTG